MYEHRDTPLLPLKAFFWRVARSVLVAVALLGVALGGGMLGYHYFEQLSWLDAFMNAAMILSGMGPVAPLHTPAGKLFAGCYALFSGLLFITLAGIILAPVAHRLIHKFHRGTNETDDRAADSDLPEP